MFQVVWANTMNILIADDHALLAQAVAHVLEKSEEFQVKVTSTRQDVLLEMAHEPYEVVLLDLRMPGMQGLSSVAEVIKRDSNARIVLFTSNLDQNFLQDALKLGLFGYIPKTLPLQSLEIALKLIVSGQKFIPHCNTSKANNHNHLGGSVSSLSDRELHILRLTAGGATNKEIARDLSSSETRIKMMMRGICGKLNARNRAHACIIAHERLLF